MGFYIDRYITIHLIASDSISTTVQLIMALCAEPSILGL